MGHRINVFRVCCFSFFQLHKPPPIYFIVRVCQRSCSSLSLISSHVQINLQEYLLLSLQSKKRSNHLPLDEIWSSTHHWISYGAQCNDKFPLLIFQTHNSLPELDLEATANTLRLKNGWLPQCKTRIGECVIERKKMSAIAKSTNAHCTMYLFFSKILVKWYYIPGILLCKNDKVYTRSVYNYIRLDLALL